MLLGASFARGSGSTPGAMGWSRSSWESSHPVVCCFIGACRRVTLILAQAPVVPRARGDSPPICTTQTWCLVNVECESASFLVGAHGVIESKSLVKAASSQTYCTP